MKKILIIFFFVCGYVLGAKAGKERYRQICAISSKISQTALAQNITAALKSCLCKLCGRLRGFLRDLIVGLLSRNKEEDLYSRPAED